MRTIAGRYELGMPLGRGGMGLVWHGTDRLLQRPVAVKLIAGDSPESADRARRRFRREARITGRLRHPGVPVLYDFGTDDGQFYMVMEVLSGCTLGDLIAEAHPLPYSWAAVIGAQICAVLAAAHAENLVHRDLKPSNVVVGRDAAVKVLDFGVAAALEGWDFSVITAAGEQPGTACYLAPERIEGQQADRASDLYAVGCLLHETLTGERVFASNDWMTETRRHRKEEPAHVTAVRPDVPGALAGLIRSLLAKDPARRPSDAIAVGAGLLSVISDLPPLPGLIDRPDTSLHLYATALHTVIAGRN